jgi:iron only hydrogenase large subunit-like protein
MSDYCVGCGECFKACPQNAKSVTTDIMFVKDLIRRGERVIVSLAPSFPSFDHMDNPFVFLSALRKLGFREIEETSIGAVNVSEQYLEDYHSDKQHIITTSCPTINFLVAKYYRHLLPYLSQTVSPMMAHNKIIKMQNKDVYTVFIGPCISKKEETSVCTSKDSCIDAVITFDDIRVWLKEEEIDINNLTPSYFDKSSPEHTHFYPLSGGVEKATIEEHTARRVIKIDGMDNCRKFLDHLPEMKGKTWIEMNACHEGCINGFGNSQSSLSLYEKIECVLDYIEQEKPHSNYEYIDIDTFYDYDILNEKKRAKFSDAEITEILHKTGKYEKADELNCGACGYDTCREKAIACLEGMADIEMCLPYMRMKNEDISNIIIENTPNGIILTDKEFHIVEFNPSSVNICMISKKRALNQKIDKVLGENVFTYLLDSKKQTLVQKQTLKTLGKTVIMSLRYIENQDLYLGIFKDVTREEMNKQRVKEMSNNALDMAQNVIDKQMRVAHEIASLLGETTAETKVTLSKLKHLFDEQF